MRKLILVLVLLRPTLAQTTPASSVTFTALGTGAQATDLQTRDQIVGYAYPDFCSTVNGGPPLGGQDNTTGLVNALAAVGTSFGVLEIPAVGTTTSNNYYCSSLGTTWEQAKLAPRIISRQPGGRRG